MAPEAKTSPKMTTEESQRRCTIQLNPILEKIGQFGKFHWFQLALVWMAMVLGSCASFKSYAFTGYLPNYRCLVPQCEEMSTAEYYTKQDYVQAAIESLHGGKHDCRRKTTRQNFTGQNACQEFLSVIQSVNKTADVETCDADDLVFDQTFVKTSFATRFGFVCDRFYLRGIFNALAMGGMLLGSFVIGAISDRFGRKPALYVSILTLWSAGLINAHTHQIGLFAFGRQDLFFTTPFLISNNSNF